MRGWHTQYHNSQSHDNCTTQFHMGHHQCCDTHTFVPDSRQNTHTTHQGHKYIYVASVLFLAHQIWKDPVIAAPVTVLNRSLFNFIIDHCSVVSLHLKCCFTETFVKALFHMYFTDVSDICVQGSAHGGWRWPGTTTTGY